VYARRITGDCKTVVGDTKARHSWREQTDGGGVRKRLITDVVIIIIIIMRGTPRARED